MTEIPILSSRELTIRMREWDSDITRKEVEDSIIKFSEIKGFGGLVKEMLGDEPIYFLTEAQILIISSSFREDLRWRLISSLLDLTDDNHVLESVVKAAVDKRLHKYSENVSLIEVYRPLTNLIACCYDNEFFAATHYQFTHLYNRLNQCNLTGYEIKELMVKKGLLTSNHRVTIGGRVKETAHYIDYLDNSHDTRYSPIYTEEDISFLLLELSKE